MQPSSMKIITPHDSGIAYFDGKVKEERSTAD
jgi:hypothetical protein